MSICRNLVFGEAADHDDVVESAPSEKSNEDSSQDSPSDDCSLRLDLSRLTIKVEEDRPCFFFRWGQEAEAATPSEQPSFEVLQCDSPNTKFCYYNNYNLSHSRHFCKSCRKTKQSKPKYNTSLVADGPSERKSSSLK
ncbi:dof zinc finger protein DOF3.1-like [Forsythia ovata]|uniref:Dof zinc finger protein DOF3.1-like n=1 Tax=Forsythia ovata TaxID=205694 RepID=A0ABD1UEM0_9LAMI